MYTSNGIEGGGASARSAGLAIADQSRPIASLPTATAGTARADCESDMIQLEDAMKAPNQTPEVTAAYKAGADKAAFDKAAGSIKRRSSYKFETRWRSSGTVIHRDRSSLMTIPFSWARTSTSCATVRLTR